MRRRPADASTALARSIAGDLRRRPLAAQLASLVLWLLAASLAVVVCDWLVPGFHAEAPLGPLLFAVVLGAIGLAVQPLLVAGAVRIGWLGVAALALAGQSIIVAIAAWVLPSVTLDSALAAFLVAVIVGVVATGVGWLSTAGTNGALVSRLVTHARRHPVAVPDPETDGVVFVQLDGVPYPVLEMAILAGTVPTMTRWVREGTHQLHEWTPKLPATTPASQFGILHGVIDGIPAFRWYDRERDRVVVTNRPADARLVESDLGTGSGLLCDDGASISNLFSGDAAETALTMSRRSTGARATQEATAKFVSSPGGLTRAVARSFSELVRDRFQARRAIRRDVQPRCHRSWTTALLRCVTNGVLRDLNTVLVAQHMLHGTHAIYVDYVDYDEIAHHAGVLRPESLEALEAVDGVLRQLEQVAAVAPRRYRFIVLSDHGQAQGMPFADRYGEQLSDVVRRLAGVDVADSSSTDVEAWGRTGLLVDELTTGRGLRSRALRSASDTARQHQLQQHERTEARPGLGNITADTFHVFGSGNLGLVYVRGERKRLTLQQLEDRFPHLVGGLTAHPGVGFVAVLDDALGPLVIGEDGAMALKDEVVVGVDPLRTFGPNAPAFVRRVLLRPEAPDIYVNSLVDPTTGEVAAFEGLVGCHGGLGGWQDRAFVLVPKDLPFPDEQILGADALHRALVAILRHLGHRRDDAGPLRRAASSVPRR
ncbi:MAG TPA: alkaline phosphatase family protein [Actinomycetales bacterium]|nr:alkaline phosphatase family protein [Actinomycetales bacterium]